MRAIIATFFKTLEAAQKRLKEKNQISKDAFVILKDKNGYWVVAKRQLE